MLDREMDEAVNRLVTYIEPAKMHNAQGRVQMLREFRQVIRDAETLLTKLGKPPTL